MLFTGDTCLKVFILKGSLMRYFASAHNNETFVFDQQTADFCLNLCLEITKIHKFIEFYSQNCFENLEDDIVNCRRETDLGKSKAVIALTKNSLEIPCTLQAY